jgi:serine/threonine protein kinase/tetratricopeptide (TPR) repeat protein
VHESHVFLNALNRTTPAERAAYLDAACAGDPRLRADVEALLRAHETDPDFLEQPAGGDTPLHRPSPSDRPADPRSGVEQPGAVLAGRYTLVEPVGEGGMGSVWKARQTEPVRRLVAVKLIKRGMDSKAVLARFEAERQALALMDHPNIATVLDAGTAPDGRPFFVMDLVDGVPITRFCDDRRLTIPQRLALFIDVCRAVQHAHQKGVIHRDLKPSNVLVAAGEERPVPKVIDFGMAKAVGVQLAEESMHTGFGTVMGTPEYMSPEQASFNPFDVDTRSDVYALGVLLYELLTGGPPFPRKDVEGAGVLEFLRVIREEEPPRPSARLTVVADLPALAARRGTEAARLPRLIRGDLDWITLKALEKDRARRYETADGLAADVGRYLTDEPVVAGPQSAAYRLRKFVRRNRAAVAASAGIAASLVAGTLIATRQAYRALRAERAADAERRVAVASEARAVSEAKRAGEEADVSQAVIDFVRQDIMEQATAYQHVEHGQPVVRDMTLRTALERAARKIDSRFAGKPLAEAAIRATIGLMFLELGEFAESSRHLERGLALRRTVQGDLHPKVLENERLLAWVLFQQGRYEESEALHKKTLPNHIEVFGEASPHTVDEMTQFAVLLTRLKRFDEAEPLHLRAVELGRNVPWNDGAMRVNNLALMYAGQGRFAEAERHYLDALGWSRRAQGEEHPNTTLVLRNLALMYLRQARHPNIDALSSQSQHAQRRIHREDAIAAAESLDRIAEPLVALGRFETAEALLRTSLRVRAERQPDDWATFNVRSLLGGALLGQQRYADAEPLLAQGYEGMKARETAAPPQCHACIPEALDRLIALSTKSGRPAEAAKWRAERSKYAHTAPPPGPAK